MSFGFSAGDFIAASQLIIGIIGSLKESGGSKSEYQELVRELVILDNTLKHLDTLKGPSVDSIKCAALSCRYPLETFLQSIEAYDKSLGIDSAAGVVKGSARKVRWLYGKKGEVAKLRAYLNMHMGIINMALQIHGLGKLDYISEQAESSQQIFNDSLIQARDALLAPMTSISRAVSDNHSMLENIATMICSRVAAPLDALAETVCKILASTHQIYSVLLDIHSSMTPINTAFTWYQQPVRFEDALGRIIPVPSEYSFGDLRAIIKYRFDHGPGASCVDRGEYELFNAKNTRQTFSLTATTMLSPGMFITMAVLFENSSTSAESRCPMLGCRSTETMLLPDGRTKCLKCDVSFDFSERLATQYNPLNEPRPFQSSNSGPESKIPNGRDAFEGLSKDLRNIRLKRANAAAKIPNLAEGLILNFPDGLILNFPEGLDALAAASRWSSWTNKILIV